MSEVSNICLSVLGYRDERKWAALALEMDLRGYGKTFDEAAKELAELVLMQISFALFKGQPDMIWKPADPVWFERFAEVRRSQLASAITEGAAQGIDYQAGGLPIPSPAVIAQLQDKFRAADG